MKPLFGSSAGANRPLGLAIASRLLKRIMGHTEWYAAFVLFRRGYLVDQGWFRSFRERQSVAADGSPIPWMAYPVIYFLNDRLTNRMDVFEYGCGHSTLWLAARVNKVVACEHDRGWYERMARRVPANVDLRQVDLVYGGAYSQVIAGFEAAFDVVVIDGRDRVSCIRNAPRALTKRGVLVLDNSDCAEYQPGIDYLLSTGMKRLDFEGPGPITSAGTRTTVFYREGNCLGI